ncbi:hypothetical protein [Phytohabitans kaempferiae]|uniref:Cation-transporting P-type ATPase C-terminal domain-containing protein n=1 Tax=Phytohabitans kaempferiae TaxID=1620943 RepID=A0ABV6MCM6_9ACTN
MLRFAVPAGVLAAAATITSYLMARDVYGGNLDAETSAATLTLFLVALWGLAIIARPYTWWRVLLVAAMGGAFTVVLVVPFLQDFFQLELIGGRAPGQAVVIAAVAGVALEVVTRLARRALPRTR